MQKFLDRVSAYLLRHYADKLDQLCIVLPNRRAKLFLKNSIGQVFQKPIWSPAIFSIEDFIVELSPSNPIDSLSAVFEFYQVYCAIEKDKAQSMDDFLQWAPTLLNDFNEIDLYLVDATALFSYLSDDRALSLWNADGKELTDFQKKYLEFWKSLSNYYTSFTKQLTEKKLVYSGLAYKQLSQNAVNAVTNKKWEKVIFAGFNALNSSERKIFKALSDAGKADFLWDTDDYYMEDTNQEAGKFLRELKPEFGKSNLERTFLWQEKNLVETPKSIVLAGVSQQISQAKLAGKLLQEIALENNQGYKNTALVLADENLLMPVLHSIPEEVGKFNVTMGYPIQQLSLATFFDLLFKLQMNADRQRGNGSISSVRFYYKDLKKFLLHPGFSMLCDSQFNEKEIPKRIRSFIKYLDSNNILFIGWKQIEEFFADKHSGLRNVIALTVQPWLANVDKCISSLRGICDFSRKILTQNPKAKHAIELEASFFFLKIINRIETLFASTTQKELQEVETIRILFNQLIRGQSISFIGEPLEGLQIMGMLETRTLDFENLILLSANEGILPAGKKENSFIPYELKKLFSLPSYAEKDAIFGYHFYRLLQHAQRIYLVYNTETDEFGSGEKSRYIIQLQQELKKRNPNVKLVDRLYTIPLKESTVPRKIEIEKTEFVTTKLNELFERGLSPSLLNTYRKCSLQFYLNYIAGLKELETPEDSVDAATFGTVLHTFLEESYLPFINQNLDQKTLKASFGNIQEKVDRIFKKEFKHGDLSTGKNLLNLKVAEKYLNTFLNAELSELTTLNQSGKQLKLLQIEHELSTIINVDGKQIKLKGKADRIDSIDGETRIVDYKTGAVSENKELKLKAWESLQEVAKNKAFQLLMYAYLYHKMNPNESSGIQSGIVSFRALSNGLMKVSLDGESILSDEVLSAFEMELRDLIASISNTKSKFVQTDDLEICSYCSFSQFCNR